MTKDEEEIAFFQQLGIAITQWSFIEDELFEIVAERMRDSQRYPFGFGFFGIENFRSKLAFCDEFLIRTMDKPHLRVFVYSESIAGRRLGLIDWPNDKPRRKSYRPPSDALCVRDIVAVRQGLPALSRFAELPGDFGRTFIAASKIARTKRESADDSRSKNPDA